MEDSLEYKTPKSSGGCGESAVEALSKEDKL